MKGKYILFYIVLFTEGASLMATELIGAKLVAPFYGNSLYVWTGILCFCVSGLALGYYAGGIISGKSPNPDILYAVLAVGSLLVFAFPFSSKVLISLTSGMGLLAGVCLTCLFLMVPPMACFGVVGPMVVRLMSSSLESLGKISGTTYFVSTFGGIVATFLFGLCLIPSVGLVVCTRIIFSALALLPIFYFSMRFLKRGSTAPFATHREKFGAKTITSKVKAVNLLKSGQSNLFYLFAVAEGASVMAIELISARMLAPWFGSSLHVWATVMGITLLGLAVGYFAGGRIASRFPGRNTLLAVLLGASVFTLLMHPVSQYLPLLFSGINQVVSLMFVSLLLILPPFVLFGMIPTLLIQYITRNIDNSGQTTGRVFSVSSFSGIVALPLIGFWAIPEFGLTLPSVVIGILTGIFPFFNLIRQKKLYAWLFLPALVFSLSFIPGKKDTPGVKVLYHSEGLLGQVMVADVTLGKATDDGKNLDGRMLFVNRMGQSQLDLATGSTKWNYSIFAPAVSSVLPGRSQALVLGLGGGTVANKLIHELDFNVDAVELDWRIADVSRRYFGLDKRVEVIVDDARHYLETTEKKYSLIFFDVFRGEVQPPHVLSLETFKKAGLLLNENGLIIVNFNGYLSGKAGQPGRSVYSTLKAAGFETKILPTPGQENERNSLFIASLKPIDFGKWRTPLAYRGKVVGLDSLLIDPATIDFSDSKLLTDDRPALDRMNIGASAKWREDYTQSFTRLFTSRGVPLFE